MGDTGIPSIYCTSSWLTLGRSNNDAWGGEELQLATAEVGADAIATIVLFPFGATLACVTHTV